MLELVLEHVGGCWRERGARRNSSWEIRVNVEEIVWRLYIQTGANIDEMKMLPENIKISRHRRSTLSTVDLNRRLNSIQIMHIREVVSKNYSPRGNFIKV